jgi:hypothetical protein
MSNQSKYVIVFAAAALLLAGVSCKPKQPEQDQNQPPVQPPPVQEQEVISPEEQEFLDSGRAKAIESETDLWPFYQNDEAGFMVHYPLDIDFASDDSGAAYRLDVQVEPVAGLAHTMGYDEETARANATALAAGEFGQGVDFGLPVSERVRDLGEVSAQDFMVLGRFEVCDVTFERKLYFVRNDQLVVLTLSADEELMSPPLADYFETDAMNCGDQSIWIFDQQADFYEQLVAGTAPPIAQDWYDLFDQVIETVIFFDQPAPVALDGRWIATDDAKSIIAFQDGKKLDFYDGQLMSEGTYQINGDRLTVTADGEVYEYSIVELTDETMILTYLARGNSLTYTRE